MTQQAPPVDWRERSGAGANTAPNIEPLSRSEGDLRRNSYRPSKYPRMSTQSVVRDDGAEITANVEELLARLIRLTESLERRETDLKRVVESLEANRRGTVALSPIFNTGFINIPGIGLSSAYASGDAFGTRFSIAVPVEGTISTVVFADLDDEGLDKEVVLFNNEFNQTGDNDVFAVTDGDLLNLVGIVSITDWYNFANNQVGRSTPALAYQAPLGRLWGQVVTRGADNIVPGHQPHFFMVIV
ncbi:MAG: hypothetical protein FJ315_03775 [SAR202 cluster bacterium]|nr:hypothetical protein [SAR202 cluster bacterium]